MTTENPIQVRIIRGIDQARMRRLTRAAWVTAAVLTLIAIASTVTPFAATVAPFAVLGLGLAPILVFFPPLILAALTLPVLAAILASGITHREISGEGGDTLWVTPLESAAIAEGFLSGVLRALEWLRLFGLALAPPLGIGCGFVAVAFVFLLGEPSFRPPGTPPPDPWELFRPVLMVVVMTGVFATALIWQVINAIFRFAVRIGVAAAFWLHNRDAGTVRAASGSFAAGMMLAMLLGCAAAALVPASPTYLMRPSASLLASLAAAVILLLVAPLAVNAWLKRALLRAIERARSRR